jgi:putative transposase
VNSNYISPIQMGASRKKGRQLSLGLPPARRKFRHGGAREGAGRPKSSRRGEAPHRARPEHKKRHPVHVVMRAVRGVPRLRRSDRFRAIRAAMRGMGAKVAFRVVHASIQGSHLHFLVEADDKETLARGVQAFAISLARRINMACGRRGKVFARYHATEITNPRQARNTLAYVLNNWRHHREDTSRSEAIDPYSTGYAFDGWREPPTWDSPGFEPLPAITPTTWLLRIGWRYYPLLSTHEVPSEA